MLYAISYLSFHMKWLAWYCYYDGPGWRPPKSEPICYHAMIPASHILFIYGDEALYLGGSLYALK